MDKLGRIAVDHWLDQLGRQVRAEVVAKLPGDMEEAIAGEVEVIEPSISKEDLPYFHEQVQSLIDALRLDFAQGPDQLDA